MCAEQKSKVKSGHTSAGSAQPEDHPPARYALRGQLERAGDETRLDRDRDLGLLQGPHADSGFRPRNPLPELEPGGPADAARSALDRPLLRLFSVVLCSRRGIRVQYFFFFRVLLSHAYAFLSLSAYVCVELW